MFWCSFTTYSIHIHIPGSVPTSSPVKLQHSPTQGTSSCQGDQISLPQTIPCSNSFQIMYSTNNLTFTVSWGSTSPHFYSLYIYMWYRIILKQFKCNFTSPSTRFTWCSCWLNSRCVRLNSVDEQRTSTFDIHIPILSGWWLYTHPVLKNRKVNWDDECNPILMGK